MNEHSVADLFQDIVDGPEPPMGVSGLRGLSDGRRLRLRRRLVQGVVSAAAVVAVVAGAATVSTMVSSQPASRQQVGAGPAAPGRIVQRTPDGRIKQPPPRWDCTREWLAQPGETNTESPEFVKCIAPADAWVKETVRKLGIEYGAVKTSAMVDGLVEPYGSDKHNDLVYYPKFEGHLTLRDGSDVTVFWSYDDLTYWPDFTPRTFDCDDGVKPPIPDCHPRTLQDGSVATILGDPTGKRAGGSVYRSHPDGLNTAVMSPVLTVDQMIEISGSPLLIG